MACVAFRGDDFTEQRENASLQLNCPQELMTCVWILSKTSTICAHFPNLLPEDQDHPLLLQPRKHRTPFLRCGQWHHQRQPATQTHKKNRVRSFALQLWLKWWDPGEGCSDKAVGCDWHVEAVKHLTSQRQSTQMFLQQLLFFLARNTLCNVMKKALLAKVNLITVTGYKQKPNMS